MKASFVSIRNCGRLAPIIAVAVTGLAISGCTRPAGSSRDSFRGDYCGWFNLPSRNERNQIIPGDNTLIPVFRRDGTYYSVCLGGEVPFKVCPDGIEWALTPSSMTGTKIGRDAAAKTHYLAVMDQQAYNNSDGRYGCGDKEPMTRIRKPSGLLDVKARRPHCNEDFLGWYQPVWLPWLKIEIQKNGDQYSSREQEYHDYPGAWYTPPEPRSLTPLPDQLGFILDQNNRGSDRLVYNEDLKRFEIVIERAEMTPSIIRMPLARIPTHSLTGDGRAPAPTLRTGIPAWR